MTLGDPFQLDRFLEAQDPVFAAALAELGAGRKRGHWMWFIFPQMRGLGASTMAAFYGITSLAEATAFLAHPVLGKRLTLCTRAVLGAEGRTLHAIFGSPDDVKFRSSMTLFARAMAGREMLFQDALDRFCQGLPDERTMKLLEG